LSERLHYSHDKLLKELVDLAMGQGYRVSDNEGHVRQVLELDNSKPGTIKRQFFEVQPHFGGLSKVFFLENIGSVGQTEFETFPPHLRTAIDTFLERLPASRRNEYRPLRIRQEKLIRQMIVYETASGESAVEFTENVSSIERSYLYGLFLHPNGPFVFFGQEGERLFRKDFLEADRRFSDLVIKFLAKFRPEMKI
jgi:hypothetical protein